MAVIRIFKNFTPIGVIQFNVLILLILAAKNLDYFRFQKNILSAMTMMRVMCSEYNF